MEKATFIRGISIKKGLSIVNPLYLPNRNNPGKNWNEIDDSYGLPFYLLRRKTGEFDSRHYQRGAEDWAYVGPREGMDPILVQFEINEMTFPFFLNKIRHPYRDYSARIFISSFQELYDFPAREFHIITKDLTQNELRLLSIRIGRRNFLGRFTYKDFIVPNGEIEGNPRPLSERK